MTKNVCCVVAAVVFLCTSTSARALGPFAVLYDDFNAASQLPPGLWEGFEFGTFGTETLRQIEAGQLRLLHRSYGGAGSNVGRRSSGMGLVLRSQPNLITGLQADITVSSVNAQDCAANSDPGSTAASAVLLANFFNSGAGTTIQNDIFAQIGVSRVATKPAGVLDVFALAFECTNSDCSTFTFLNVLDLGDTAVGVTNTVLMKWDAINNLFRFQLNGNAEQTISYAGFSDATAPAVFYKQLRVTKQTENCAPPGARRKAVMDARFDNIRVE